MKRSGLFITQPTNYKAFIPSNLPPNPPINIDTEMQELLQDATMLLARLDGIAYTLPNSEIFIAMYVKKEALLSSQIEGTQASLEDIFEFERGTKPENINDVSEVINYIKALDFGIQRLDEIPMSLKLIKELHAIILQKTRGANKTPGEFKKSQNWIGSAGCTLNNAAFVPPPPKEALDAMGQLEKYMHKKSHFPVLIDCALIHYQFETIHPFLDGNGRVGRLLITFYLYWKDILKKPLLYMSYYLKKNRQEYYDRLTLVRKNDDYEQWIKFFLKGIIEISQSAIENTRRILDLKDQHQKIILKYKSPTLTKIMLLNKLFRTPIISINEVQKEFKITHQSASKLISSFEQLGILKEITGKKRDRKFAYNKYLEILSEGTKPL
jgi:Fic family protein